MRDPEPGALCVSRYKQTIDVWFNVPIDTQPNFSNGQRWVCPREMVVIFIEKPCSMIGRFLTPIGVGLIYLHDMKEI